MSQIEIYLSAKNLPNKDSFSKSDPFAVLLTKKTPADQFKEFDRSEVVKDNLSPEFSKRFLLDYVFEVEQICKVMIFDCDDVKSGDLSKHDFLGFVEFTLAELVTTPGQVLHKNLLDKNGKLIRKNCVITVKGEESSSSKDIIKLSLRAEKLDKKDLFGKSDPFLEFYKLREDGSWQKTHTTEVVKSNLNPSWKEIVLPCSALFNNDKSRPIKVKCFDWDKDGSSDFIGECDVTIHDMTASSAKFDLKNPELLKKKNYKNSGILCVQKIEIVQVPSFLDYIKGGCKVSLMVAVDFTASNGDPSTPSSLHFRRSGAMNQYQEAIQSVGRILAPYDSDQSFPVWGFGGKINGEVNHCFALSMDESNPEVYGVEGILSAYNKSFNHVTLSGPTLFTQVIETATVISAEPFSEKQHYSILLIITDGEINDMASTVSAIQHAAKNPLSIIIVGVGDADFTNMEILDGDDNKESKFRDIVQFVPYRNFAKGNPALLAQETLAEIPNQFITFMKQSGYQPNKALRAKTFNIESPISGYPGVDEYQPSAPAADLPPPSPAIPSTDRVVSPPPDFNFASAAAADPESPPDYNQFG